MEKTTNMVQETTTNEELNRVCFPDFNTLYEAYLKMDKETLAMLLAAKEAAAQQPPYSPVFPQPYPVYPTYPVYPSTPSYPWITWNITC